MWHDLGAHEVLGRDENATILKLDQPDLRSLLRVVPIKVSGQPGYMQPLYFVLEYYVWPLVQRSSFMLRFLSSAFGLLAVAVTYRLGRALWSREAGLIGGLLTALLPLLVQYAQIARPYSLLVLLSLASAYFLVRAWATNRPAYWAGFALTGAASFYAHYNALFALASEALFTAVVWLAALVAERRKRRPPLRSGRLAGPLLGWLALGLLCAPGLIQLASLPWAGLRGGEAGAEITVRLSGQFFADFTANIGLTSPWLRALLIGLVAVGLAAALYRRRWQAVLLTALWVTVPFVFLATVKSPRPFVERYLIFVPPMALLLAGQGVAAIGHGLAAWGPLRRKSPAWLGAAAAVACCAGLMLLFARPLRAYYKGNRAVDRLGETVVVIERNARAGDAVIISPRFFIRPLAVNGAEVLTLTRHLSPAELDDLAARYDRIWLLYTSNLPAELQEPLDRWYLSHKSEFAQVPIKAITALAYRNLALTDPVAGLKDKIAILEELAASDHKAEAWLRHGILADAYQALSALYVDQGRSDLAAEYQQRADQTRVEVPAP